MEIKEIREIIPTGKDSTVSARTLGSMYDIGTREITKAIELGRQSGDLPACADADGYYLAENKKEMEEYRRRLKRRILHLIKTYRGLEKAEKNLPD